MNVALSLRDRKAERFTDVIRANNVQEPIDAFRALGTPVAERQGYVGFGEPFLKFLRIL